ncbi:hypothetical protein GCM10009765_83040 [Fodinicola feengrottensis]|uniref:Uncharacterized protein n=1 Tax=Fodinicola feengrottensis TaxID=435914 RepID=A0ABN2JCI5_9ACTN
MAVTGRVADGWTPGHVADWLSERFAQSRLIIDRAAEAIGRDPADIATIDNMRAPITATPLATEIAPAVRPA